MSKEEFLDFVEKNKKSGLGNWSYKITDSKDPHCGETLWSGRYCAIAAFVFMISSTGEYYVLANKRGSGVPDFKGFWNCPCGFMESYESGEYACTRETLEETGLYIDPSKFKMLPSLVETDPIKCNKAHVTISYTAIISDEDLDPINNIENPENLKGGEENEVESIKWIPLDKVGNYKWAFNHLEKIKYIISKR